MHFSILHSNDEMVWILILKVKCNSLIQAVVVEIGSCKDVGMTVKCSFNLPVLDRSTLKPKLE